MEFVTAERILTGQDARTRQEALRTICRHAAELGIASDAEAVYRAFLEREELGATGISGGFAVPHAKCAAIHQPAAIVFKNVRRIEWPSFDDQPIDIAVALLIPAPKGREEHIRLLSKTAVLLMDADFRALLRSSDDAHVLAPAIEDALERP